MADHDEAKGAPGAGGSAKAGAGGGESLFTVLVALVANALLAVAKSVAAVVTGSAAMVAEAAHSWSDTGNEVFLLVAERRGARPADTEHPRGYGRSTYIWSLVAAFGLFSAGAVVSVWHGVTELFGEPGKASFTVNYIVLGIAFVLEGSSFVQAARQVHGAARRFGLHPLRYVDRTSNPTLRAVVLEDSSALAGLVLAGAGIALHQITGHHEYDAAGSIAVGLLLAVVAVFLMRRNMQFLLGQSPPPAVRDQVVRQLLEVEGVQRVTYVHVEFVGPSKLFVVAAVDLTGDDAEPDLARRLRTAEKQFEERTEVVDAVFTLAQPDDPDLVPGERAGSAHEGAVAVDVAEGPADPVTPGRG